MDAKIELCALPGDKWAHIDNKTLDTKLSGGPVSLQGSSDAVDLQCTFRYAQAVQITSGTKLQNMTGSKSSGCLPTQILSFTHKKHQAVY